MVLLLGWSVTWFAFFPGILNPDAIVQSEQIITGKFSNWHPIAHTFYLYFFHWMPAPLFFLILFQLVAGAGLLTVLLQTLVKIGASKKLTILATLILAVAPYNGLYLVTTFKDVPYTFGVISLCLLLIIALKNQEVPLFMQIAIVCATLTAMLFRHNGIPIVFSLLLLAFFAPKTVKSSFFRLFVWTISLFLSLQIAFAIFLPGSQNGFTRILATYCESYIRSSIKKDGLFLAKDDEQTLKLIYPDWFSNPQAFFYALYFNETDTNNFDQYQLSYFSLCWKATYTNPEIILNQTIRRNRQFMGVGNSQDNESFRPHIIYVSNPIIYPDGNLIYLTDRAEMNAFWKLQPGQQPPFPIFSKTIYEGIYKTIVFGNGFVWRPIYYLLLLLGSGVVYLLGKHRNKKNTFLALTPLMLHILIMLIMGGRMPRYHLPTFWGAIVFFPLLLAPLLSLTRKVK
jgi:hypothetical protein